jgi:hypothetical protein
MLLELLPHFARLMPMADKFLSTRSASDKAQEAALASLAREVRGEFDKVAEANEGLGRQVKEQGAQVAELGVDVTRTRMGVESVEARVSKLEKTAGVAIRLLWVALGLLVIVLVLLGIVAVRGMR